MPMNFSKISLITSLLTLSIFSYLFFSIPNTIDVRDAFSSPPLIMVLANNICCLIGIASAILSFINKEPSTWYKWLGAILNLLLFTLTLGSIIFARLVYTI